MLLIIDNAFKIGLQTLGLGMGIVIAMLMLLAAILYIIIPIFRKISERKPKSKDKKTGEQAVSAPVSSVSESNDDDEETVAAIIAAIAAYEGKAPEGFRVVSFKKI